MKKPRVQLHQKKKITENSTLKTLTKSLKQKQKGFCYCLKKTFNEYHEKDLQEGNFDCEDGFVTDFLTKVAKKNQRTHSVRC